MCARYRPVFALSMSELGRCTNAEATFPLPPDTRPIDRAPYRANPKAKAAIDKCVHDMLKWDIIEGRPSPWGSPCTLVAKNGSPRFCVDYRHTLNRHIVRKSWPLPNLDSCLDAVGGVKFISRADVLTRFGNYPSQRSTSTGQHSSLRPASSVLNVCLLEFVMPLGCFNT